jgi:hypothetical protein
MSKVELLQTVHSLLLALLAFWYCKHTFCMMFETPVANRFLIPFTFDLDILSFCDKATTEARPTFIRLHELQAVPESVSHQPQHQIVQKHELWPRFCTTGVPPPVLRGDSSWSSMSASVLPRAEGSGYQ